MPKKDIPKLLTILFLLSYLHILTQLIFLRIYTYLRLFYIWYNILSSPMYIFLFLTLKYPGYVPPLEHLNLIQNLIAMRSCNKCNNIKPQRSYHCRICKRCIKRMDHHCPWLNMCINSDNIAYFIRFLFFTSVSAFTMFLVLLCLCINNMKTQYTLINKYTFPVIILNMVMCLSLAILLFLFFMAQVRSVACNVSYIERLKLMNLNRYYKNPYDRGVWNNLRGIMGYPWMLYMYGEKGDGLMYEKVYDCEVWPPQANTLNYYL